MKQIKKEIEFLEFLIEQILMEKDTYSFVIKKYQNIEENDKNLNFISDIKNIIIEYNKFYNSISKMLKNRKKEVKKDDLLFKIATYYSIDIKNSTLSEIYKHLIHGTEVVKSRILDKFNEDLSISKTIGNLVNRLILFEDKNINNFNIYLHKFDI